MVCDSYLENFYSVITIALVYIAITIIIKSTFSTSTRVTYPYIKYQSGRWYW